MTPQLNAVSVSPYFVPSGMSPSFFPSGPVATGQKRPADARSLLGCVSVPVYSRRASHVLHAHRARLNRVVLGGWQGQQSGSLATY
jgi:hypothetical protein